MIVYKIRPDGVYEGSVEMEDSTVLPFGYTWSQPPEIPDGFYAVLNGDWQLEKGTPPEVVSQINAPVINLTPEQKLSSLGLTVDDLKALLGIQ